MNKDNNNVVILFEAKPAHSGCVNLKSKFPIRKMLNKYWATISEQPIDYCLRKADPWTTWSASHETATHCFKAYLTSFFLCLTKCEKCLFIKRIIIRILKPWLVLQNCGTRVFSYFRILNIHWDISRWCSCVHKRHKQVKRRFSKCHKNVYLLWARATRSLMRYRLTDWLSERMNGWLARWLSTPPASPCLTHTVCLSACQAH